MRNIIALALASLASFALAHATVRTELGASDSLAGRTETYRLQVPVEKSIATTEIRLLVPDGVTVSRFLPVPGFTRTVERNASGRITAVTWRGRLQPDEFGRFLFQATNPADPGTLVWKAYQKSADGSVTPWDDSAEATPASRTTVK